MSAQIKLIVVTAKNLRKMAIKYFDDLIYSLDFYGNKISGIKVIVADQDPTILSESIERHRPDGVFFTRGYGTSERAISLCKKYGIKILYQLDDVHGDKKHIDKLKSCFDFSDFIFASYYKNIISRNFAEYKYKICNFPFHGPSNADDFLNNKSIIKNHKILMSGRVTAPYVFRRSLINKINKDKFLKHNTTILNHPGYNHLNLSHDIVRDQYYKLVSQSRASIVTSAKKPLNYPLFKYFETPACGTLMLAENIPSLSELGFIPGEHFININDNNIKSVFKFVLNKKNDKLINKIRKNSLNLVKDKHNAKNRVDQVIRVLRENKVFHWND